MRQFPAPESIAATAFSLWKRNRGYEFRSFARLPNPNGDISLGYDPNHAARCVNSGNSSDLVLFHQVQCLLPAIIGRTLHDFARHNLVDQNARWISAVGHSADRHIAVRNDADEYLFL